MTENEISEMIADYGSALPAYRPRSRTRGLRLGLLAGGAVVGGSLVFLFSPKAEAHGYDRMMAALRESTTMEAHMYRLKRNGRYEQEMHTWIQGNRFADEAFRSSKLHDLIVSTPSGLTMNYMDFGVSTFEPVRSNPLDGKRTILNWVIDSNDVGMVEGKKTMRRLASQPVNGHAVYLLEFEKQSAHSHKVERVWVDAKTDLPVRCSVQLREDRIKDDYYVDYQFGGQIPEQVFQPQFQPVIDLPSRQAALVTDWSRRSVPIEPNTKLLDAQMSEDGSLYLLYNGAWSPAKVVGPGGRVYVKSDDYEPGGVRGDTDTRKRLKALGVQPLGAIFVPANLQPVGVGEVKVTFRPISEHGWLKVKTASGPDRVITVQPRPCKDWPDYAWDLVLGQFFLQTDVWRAIAQAKALEAAGDIDGALAAYKLMEKRQRRFLPEKTYRWLKLPEAMLRRAGRTADANRLKRQIDALERGDPSTLR